MNIIPFIIKQVVFDITRIGVGVGGVIYCIYGK